jgi:LysM repeat protein
MFFRWLRRLFILALVIGIFAIVGIGINANEWAKRQIEIDLQVTRAIETAIAARLFEATRTVEAPLPQYRLVTLAQGEALLDVAQRYNTTIEVLRMANQLLPTVDFGTDETIIVPEGIQILEPPRSFTPHTVVAGDTLSALAALNDVTIEQIVIDNPVLAGRELIPGDIVFIPHLLA